MQTLLSLLGADLRPHLGDRLLGDLPFSYPLRVLFFHDSAEIGGAAHGFHAVLKFLDPRVIHRTVVLPRRGRASESLESARVADEIIIEPNLVEHPVEPWSRPMSRDDFGAPPGRKSLRLLGNIARAGRAFTRLSELVKRGGYDLLYCNGASAELAGGILSAATSVPALWHVRYTSIPRLVAPIHRLLAASAGVRRIMCVPFAANSLFSHCRDKIRVLHHAVDLDEFSAPSVVPRLRRELGLSPETVVFGAHGRSLGDTGRRAFLAAAKLALSRMTKDEAARARFVVIGDPCENAARDDDAVLFVGTTEDDRPFVVDFDVAVAPGAGLDPAPRSVIESMALGKPVIGFDVGSLRDVIDEGVTGTLVPRANVSDLADQMLRYHRHADVRARQGVAARSHVERSFDARRHARAIQNEIVGIVGEPAGC